MAFDGQGNFVRVHNWTQDAANNIDISATEMDAEDNGFAAGLSNCVTRDGQGKMSQDFTPSADNVLNLGTNSLRWATLNGVAITQIPVNLTSLGQLLYPITAAETSAAGSAAQSAGGYTWTITQPWYPPGNVKRYGAVGDGVTADDNAILCAMAQAYYPGGARIVFPLSINADSGGYTTNFYIVTTTLAIALPSGIAQAGLYFYGETDRMSTTGPSIRQRTNGISTFSVTGSGAISVSWVNVSMSGESATAPANTALVYINPTTPYGPSSFYFENCWFQTPVYYAVYASCCDDVKFTNCTFDITGERWLGIGITAYSGLGLTFSVTNLSIVGCTFADGNPNAGAIDLGGVRGGVITGNRFYSNTANSPYCLNFQTVNSASLLTTGIAISGNYFYGYNSVLVLGHYSSNGNSFTGNTILGCTAPAIVFGGGTTVSGWTITGNQITGYAGAGNGLINSAATPVQNCNISGNTYIANSGGTSSYCLNLAGSSTSNNVLDPNVYVGWSAAPVAILTFTNNGLIQSGSFAVTSTGLSGATGTIEFTCNGNYVLLRVPNVQGAASATAVTLNGVPSYLWATTAQSMPIFVENNSANVVGSANVTNSAAITLGVGAGGAFANAGNQGCVAGNISYSLV